MDAKVEDKIATQEETSYPMDSNVVDKAAIKSKEQSYLMNKRKAEKEANKSFANDHQATLTN